MCATRCNSMDTLQAFSFPRGHILMIFGKTATKIITFICFNVLRTNNVRLLANIIDKTSKVSVFI